MSDKPTIQVMVGLGVDEKSVALEIWEGGTPLAHALLSPDNADVVAASLTRSAKLLRNQKTETLQ